MIKILFEKVLTFVLRTYKTCPLHHTSRLAVKVALRPRRHGQKRPDVMGMDVSSATSSLSLSPLFLSDSIFRTTSTRLPAFLYNLENSHFVYILLMIKLKLTKMDIKVNIKSHFYEEAPEFLMLANSV